MAKARPLNKQQEAYAQAVVKNGGDKVAAYEAAGYSMTMSMPAIQVQADKLYNHPKIRLRIRELQSAANEVAKERFNISIEQRLMWLKEVAEAGLTKQVLIRGESMIEQRENLNAVNGAIKIMNEMLGVNDGAEDEAKSLTIQFNVAEPVGDIVVTRGKSND